MSTSESRPPWLEFGVAAELSRAYGKDQREFFVSMAALLENAFPQETEVERRGGLFSKKILHAIVITLNDNRYSLEDPGRGNLLARRTHIVRGIALKTEEVALDTWIEELGAAIQDRARHSEAARNALSRFSEF